MNNMTADDWVSGKIGNYALDFDGSNDWIPVNTLASYFVNSSYTISTWFQANGANHHKFMFSIHLGGSNRLGMGIYNNKFDYAWTGNGHDLSATTVNDDSWYHGTLVYDKVAGKGYIYVNGNLENTIAMGIIASADRVSIGQEWDSSNSDFFKGKIDDMAVWNRALSGTEISQIHSSVGGIDSILNPVPEPMSLFTLLIVMALFGLKKNSPLTKWTK